METNTTPQATPTLSLVKQSNKCSTSMLPLRVVHVDLNIGILYCLVHWQAWLPIF